MAFSILKETGHFPADMVWPLYFWFSGVLGTKSKNEAISLKKIPGIYGFISTALPRQVEWDGDGDGGQRGRRGWVTPRRKNAYLPGDLPVSAGVGFGCELISSNADCSELAAHVTLEFCTDMHGSLNTKMTGTAAD